MAWPSGPGTKRRSGIYKMRNIWRSPLKASKNPRRMKWLMVSASGFPQVKVRRHADHLQGLLSPPANNYSPQIFYLGSNLKLQAKILCIAHTAGCLIFFFSSRIVHLNHTINSAEAITWQALREWWTTSVDFATSSQIIMIPFFQITCQRVAQIGSEFWSSVQRLHELLTSMPFCSWL